MAIQDDLSEDETIERLLNWWRENWIWLLSGVVLGIAILAGYFYWNNRQAANADAAGQIYRQMVAASDSNNFAQMESLQGQLDASYDATPYADQGNLLMARMYVETGEYDMAVTALRDVMDDSDDAELAAIARLRLARVLIQQDKADEALALVQPDAAGAFSGAQQEVRGDAFFAKGDSEGARTAYAAALAATSSSFGANTELLQLKLADLDSGAVPTGTATATPAQAAP